MKNIILTILLLFSILIIIGLLFYQSAFNFSPKPPVTTTTHHMVVEKMEAMGKIELVKYQYKDVIKHELKYDWFPDPKVILIVAGEAVGCLDLTRVDSNHVQIINDTVFVQLPEPEFCYVKIDHQQSKVFETWYTYWNEAEMVDEAYRLAEEEIKRSAEQSNILNNSRTQARLILKPMLEAVTNKKVVLQFPESSLRIE